MLDQIDLNQHIRMLARTVRPTTVHSLDAIHLGTALRSRPLLTSFVTYAKRLLDVAGQRACHQLACLTAITGETTRARKRPGRARVTPRSRLQR